MKSNKLILLLAALLIAFVLGVGRLLQLRLAVGDSYPPYSTLRGDPLGTRVYFESLAQLHGLDVQRLYDDTDKIGAGRDTTLFVLGTETFALAHVPENESKDLEKFMQDGGRLIISLFPTADKSWNLRRVEQRAAEKKQKGKSPTKKKPADKEKDKEDPKSAKKKRTPGGKLDPDEKDFRSVSILTNWGVTVEYLKLDLDADGVSQPVTARREDAAGALPESLSWHTAVIFTNLTKEWRTIFARDGRPVLIERPFGHGTLVFSADSYFASNEAMRRERHPALLAWLAGANRRLLFDETHLGVENNPGIASLARKYRLHGLAIGLLLLCLLFIWKNATSFVPPYEDEAAHGEQVAGKDSAAAFVNLLRRSIPAADLLSTCFDEWKKSCARSRSGLDARVKQMQAVVIQQIQQKPGERKPIADYQALSRILNTKK